MIRVGWLADLPNVTGGAELTQAEFREAAPDDVEVVTCPPGEVVAGLDRYVIHNCNSYDFNDVRGLRAPIIRYVNDLWPTFGDPYLRAFLLTSARLIFTSPLHLVKFPWDHGPAVMIPPAVPLERYREARDNGHREGNVCVGRMAYGKGTEDLERYPEPVDVYSLFPVASRGSVDYRGALAPEEVPEILNRYQRFVFLPNAVEPFGRSVVEAWAAGCELIVNRNVGAIYWIREKPEALATASEDFWETVLA